MIRQYVICAEGGCAGNFIASLIRTMEDPEHYDLYGGWISENGACDFTSFAAWLHYDYLFENRKIRVYPETTNSGFYVMQALLDPEATYAKYAPDYFKDKPFLLSVLHFWDPINIEKMLAIPNLYVILVRCHDKDLELAVYNKIFKNFEKGRTNKINEILWSHEGDLIKNGKEEMAKRLKSVDDMTKIPADILEELISYKRNFMLERNTLPLPKPNDKLLTLYLDDVYNNRDGMLTKISSFTGLEKNESTDRLYDD